MGGEDVTASEKLAELEEAVRELLAALGPCGSFDKKGNCRNHFATCPCPVEEADLMLAKMRETTPEPERSCAQDSSYDFTPLRRTAIKLRLRAFVLQNYQKETADTMRGFAKEIDLWIESMENKAEGEMKGIAYGQVH
jgi:hypothetical protein